MEPKIPFVIGPFCGNSKPNDVATYPNDFVTEFEPLHILGARCNDKHYNLVLSAIVTSQQGRLSKNVKGHAGYFGCDKCTQERKHRKGRMTFPETDDKLLLIIHQGPRLMKNII